MGNVFESDIDGKGDGDDRVFVSSALSLTSAIRVGDDVICFGSNCRMDVVIEDPDMP